MLCLDNIFALLSITQFYAQSFLRAGPIGAGVDQASPKTTAAIFSIFFSPPH
jgi:hypothetical protein